MKQIKLVALLAALMAVLSISASGASAAGTPTFQPPATAFTGTGQTLETLKVGGHKYEWAATLTTNNGTGPYIKCEKVSLSGTTSSGVSSEVNVKPSYAQCSFNYLGSLVSATWSTPENWTLTAAAGLVLPKYKGSIQVRGPVTITIPSMNCTLTIGEQAVGFEGVNDAGAPPAGTTINPASAAPLNVAYSGNSGCLVNGINNGLAKYRGPVHIPGIYLG